ncbi:MAG: serine/threonine-protein kinase [Chloroflexi bacterium]|nr:serine/threonine-protein kinase [Chloroflexota bacterium]
MSIVYKARDLRFSIATRLCAVKEMRNAASDPSVRAMAARSFDREANILASLSHPGIVQVYDYFIEGENCYLVLEYLEGRDLETILTETSGFLPERDVISWMVQVCDVLTYLHSRTPQPIIFRDLKPSNVMVDDFGHVKLVDFGIARVFAEGEKGTMVGTEGYSPPEQYRGDVDPRADIYALGAAMHHLLTKQDPRLEPPFSFKGRPVQAANPNVSDELVAVVNRALEYDVDKRYSSVQDLKDALLGLVTTPGTAGSRSTVSHRAEEGDPVVLWQFACEDEVRSSPVAVNDVVYVGSYDNNLYAIRASDGRFVWKYPTEGHIGSSPCVLDGRVYIGSVDAVLYAVGATTGRISWTCPTRGSIWSSPRAAYGHVFFGSDDRHLYAVNAQSGRVAWGFETEGPVRSSVAVGHDVVFFGCEGGVIYCVDISGKVKWRFRARQAVTSSPCLAGENVYVGGHDRHVYGIEAHSGWAVWRYRTEGPVISSPAVDGDLVFVGSADGCVYALDREGGRLLWRYRTDGQVTSSPAVSQGVVCFGATDGVLYSLDARTGGERWRFRTGGPVTSSPCIVDGVVYVGSNDHHLYALSV